MFYRSLRLAASLAIAVVTTTAHADSHAAGDAVKGKKVFKKCAACHNIGEGAKIKVGPPLTDVVGRKAASFDGFKYGKSIAAAGEAGLVWSEEELFDYLVNPKNFLRAKLENKKAKSKMAFRLKKEQDRADVIAYLKSLNM
ncbi:MAG: c-type cytochrome [Rhizobiaceae bacterium]|nr:c-type cytochrome [Rhizobiaceae bacterium]